MVITVRTQYRYSTAFKVIQIKWAIQKSMILMRTQYTVDMLFPSKWKTLIPHRQALRSTQNVTLRQLATEFSGWQKSVAG